VLDTADLDKTTHTVGFWMWIANLLNPVDPSPVGITLEASQSEDIASIHQLVLFASILSARL
jgi:hypothetical protein